MGGETLLNKKKVFGIVGTGAIALGLVFGVGSPLEQVSASEEPVTLKEHKQKSTEFHQGEKPARVFKDAQTGVYTEVYASDPKEREALMKEQGWTEKDPILIVNKEKNKKTKGKFEDTLESLSAGLINTFGTITASAGTDTSGWDWVGTEYWLMYANKDRVERDTTWHSHGGDYMFRLPAHSYTSLQSGASRPLGAATLFDYDGGLNTTGDDYITEWEYYPSAYNVDYSVSGMSNFLDGGEAEPYTTHRQNYAVYDNKLYNVKYYD